MSQLLCPLSSVHCLWRWSIVVFFWLLATPPKASQKTATAVKSLFPAIEALKYCEILPFQFGRVMLCPLQACFVPAPASAEAKPHKQGGWAKHISSLQKHTTPFPVKDSTKTHPLSIMATRIHTPHNEVHQSVIALPKAVQELLIRHLLEPWAWAARGCTWLWFFQIGCPKSPLVSYAFKLQHQNWRLISSNFQPKLHTSTSTWSSWCVVRCWTLSLICTVPQKQISKKLL